jgi:glycosyltransferase involved in cell wall biosynthesis
MHTIAHILPWPTVGGVERATFRTAQVTESESLRNIAFCLEGASRVRDMFKAGSIDTATYSAPEPRLRHPAAFVRASNILAREFRDKGVDLVHCSDLIAGLHTALAGRLAGLPVLCHVRGIFGDISWRACFLLRAVNKFVFISRSVWEGFGCRVPERRGIIIYDAVETAILHDTGEARKNVRSEFGIPDSAFVVGTLGHITPVKDYGTVVRAAARIVRECPNVKFLLVGDHSSHETFRRHYPEVLRIIAEHGLQEYFIFTGFRTDVSRIISALDVLVLSTHSEGLGLCMLEAMAQGHPVAATAVGGIPEVIVHDQTGLLHPHGDDQRLADNILFLFRDPERARRLALAGQRLVRDGFSMDRLATDMTGLYRTMLQGRR